MPSAIALPDASIDVIECPEAFAVVKDDEGLAREIGRLLAPGGIVRIRVPSIGPLAGFDAFNLQRYLVDTTHRGERPPETIDLGWRRHYDARELLALLGQDDFAAESVTRHGFAVGEVLTFGAVFLFRWLKPNPDRYDAFKRIIAPIDRLERRLATPIGFWIEIVARKTTCD